MDDKRFDALTLALARGTSRRAAIKGIVGGVVGGFAVATRLDRASADDECDCPTVACLSVTCNGKSCSYSDNCEDPCKVCNTLTGICDPKECDPCDVCVEGVCTGDCSGKCCGTYCAPECCTASDCDPYIEDQCGIRVCNAQGICDPISACGPNERCCDSGTPQHYCAVCCSDGDCLSCQTCNSAGVCEDQECCGDSDCYGSCGDCVEGTCVSRCEAGKYCCDYTNACLERGACCRDSDCPCGGYCSEGVCYPQCPANFECCNDTCVATGSCCQEAEEACMVTDGPGTQGNCCADLLCCPTNSGGACAECCDSDDCGLCQECVSGICVLDASCCIDARGSCNAVAGTGSVASPACCEGLICCDLGGDLHSCLECCSNADCGSDGQCDDGECKYPHLCRNDGQCPRGTCCCRDGSCSGKCCHRPHPHPKPPKPPKPAPPSEETVTTLPATGTGASPEPSGILGASALGVAAAALLAAKTLRADSGAVEPPTGE